MELVNLIRYFACEENSSVERGINSPLYGTRTGGELDEAKVSRPVRGAAGGKDSFELAPPADSIKLYSYLGWE